MFNENLIESICLFVCLFSKDLWSESGSGPEERSKLSGYSDIGAICTESRFSIVEEQGGFASVGVNINLYEFK